MSISIINVSAIVVVVTIIIVVVVLLFIIELIFILCITYNLITFIITNLCGLHYYSIFSSIISQLQLISLLQFIINHNKFIIIECVMYDLTSLSVHGLIVILFVCSCNIRLYSVNLIII